MPPPSAQMLSAARSLSRRLGAARLPNGVAQDVTTCQDYLSKYSNPKDLRPPTNRQIKQAKKISSALKIRINPSTYQTTASLLEFINEHSPAFKAIRIDPCPTPNQLKYALFLSEALGEDIPGDCSNNAAKLSEWITASKFKLVPTGSK